MLLTSPQEQTQEQQDCVKRVLDAITTCEKLQRQLRDRWDQWYGLSRNYRRWSREHAQASNPRDKDIVVNEVKREFGDDLFVPMAHVVLETNVPRILASDPTLTVRAKTLEAEDAAEPVRELFHRDLAAMGYGRRLQEVVRSGLRYGLGVQKLYWKQDKRTRRSMKPRVLGLGRRVVEDEVVLFEGPMAEARDIRDVFWDPSAWDVASSDYMADRTWRSDEYVLGKMQDGTWEVQIDPEIVRKGGSTTKRGELWSGRYAAAGIPNYSTEGLSKHEVLEYWTREKVYTVLDREYLVKEEDNPFLHGDLPFQIYRPTLVEHEFLGIGEVEPIAHLLYELNSLRGQRRDAATLALNRGFFYQAGGLDPSQMQTGIGIFNPVFGIPSEIIQPMPFSDIPQSGVSEEESIKSDIELTSAMSEAITGGGGEGTATETQLVQAAAGMRIKQKAKNLHEDLLRPATAQMRELYLQHFVDEAQSQEIRVDDPRLPTGYSYVKVTPDMLAAPLEISPEDGSTEPDDPTRKRQEAVELLTALAPFAEKLELNRVLKHVLSRYGVEDPNGWLAHGPDPEQLVNQIGEAMNQAGIPQPKILQILQSVAGGGQPQPEGAPEGAPEGPPEQQPEPTGAPQ